MVGKSAVFLFAIQCVLWLIAFGAVSFRINSVGRVPITSSDVTGSNPVFGSASRHMNEVSARVCPSGEHRMSWEVAIEAVRTNIGLIFESRFSKWFGVSVVRRGWSGDLLTGVTIGLIAALVTP